MRALLLLVGWIQLAELHAPNGARILINPAEITSIREPTESGREHFTPGVHCLVSMVNGQFNAVRETCDQIRALVTWKPP